MKQQGGTRKRIRFPMNLVLVVTVFFCFGGFTATAAFATYQQVGTFAGKPGLLKEREEPWPEEVQLGSVGGMAVNYTGAGGVPKGTLYAANFFNNGGNVARYNPDGSFSERWTFSGSLGGAPEARCGPEGDPAHPNCGAVSGGGASGVDVDVDQSTGDIYVLDGASGFVSGTNRIHVYTPDGAKLIAEFGESAPGGDTFADSPGKIHASTLPGGISVDGEGHVYIYDNAGGGAGEKRLMEFEPQSAGDYEHYVYAGQSHDFKLKEIIYGPVFDAAGNLYTHSDSAIQKFDPNTPGSPPSCEFKFPAGGVVAITVDPLSGEVFFRSFTDKKIHALSPCNGEGKFTETAKFAVSPPRTNMSALAFDPVRQVASNRPPGVLYGGATDGSGGNTEDGPPSKSESALGYIFAHPVEQPPEVLSESAAHVTATTAEVNAQINPNGPPTRFAIQYIDDAAYQANEPDERQSLRISATGGVFGLGFEGKSLGGAASANLSSGSNQATSLHTITGTATLKAANGTGDIGGAKGKGTVIEKSETITAVNPSEGKFEVGQGISGNGIPSGSTIVSVTAEAPLTTLEVKISQKATESIARDELSTGTKTVTEVSTSEGAFEVGQQISGEGILSKTTIAAVEVDTPTVGLDTLTLSSPAFRPATGVALHAGSTTLRSFVPGIGHFKVGETIEGEGIPVETTITAIGSGTLTLSKAVNKPGTGVAVFSSAPEPLAVGEQVEGPGIPAGTTITAIQAGKATLSNPATASGEGVTIHAGLPYDVSAQDLRRALEVLPSIGAGNVKVSGGPGDEAGASPYEITFVGSFDNVDVPELSADDSFLSGGPAEAEVQTEHQGGGGFESGTSESPLGGAPLGEGNEALNGGASLSGLAPGTTYHYRAVATSHCSEENLEKVCTGNGASRSFHTAGGGAPVLPDHRAYELVSPTEKAGGSVYAADPSIAHGCGNCKPGGIGGKFPRQSSPDGEAVAYEGSAFSGEGGAVNENEYISRRNAKTGWQTVNPSPAKLASRGGTGYKAFDTQLTRGVFDQDKIGSGLTPEAPAGYLDLYAQPVGNPLSLESLLSEAPTNRTGGEFNLAYAGASSDLSHVFFEANDVLTSETPVAPEPKDGGKGEKAFLERANLYEWAEGQVRLVNVEPGNTETEVGAHLGAGSAHSVSADGSRVFWEDASHQVYVRENAETTVEIPAAGGFVAAATDGSKVLLSSGALYDLETEATTDLTEEKGGFQGVVGESNDLSHVYFVDTAVLNEVENEYGAEAQPGKFNLYAWEAGGPTRFVATLVAKDGAAGGGVSAEGQSADWGIPSRRTAEASPRGRYLAFRSVEALTGYDNTGPCITHAPCAEAFLYDSATGKLRCASCNPSGQPPLGPSTLRLIFGAPAAMPQPRYLTDQGRLYFDSQDSLSPFDTNEGFEDVYQYEPNGVGTCERDAGCLNLISAGSEPQDANLLAVDESGKNVFFTTRDQLVLKDHDDLVDLYDAREDGGIPGETEVSRGECQGEACVPAISPPNDPTPGSSTFQGAGNVDEKKAAKKHAKKHKKKHAKKKAHKRAAKHNRGGAK